MTNEKYQNVQHSIAPFYDKDSTILILGSFPSVKSRETNFFYGHPKNRFWQVLAFIFQEDVPQTIDAKKAFLKKHHIALWDVIASCQIIGSQDRTIKNVKVNDLQLILNTSMIKKIYTNGQLANELYEQYLAPIINCPKISLPSTSPANARYSLRQLIDKWQIINN